MRFQRLLLLPVCAVLFFSCARRHDGNELAANLSSVDAYIKTGQADDALSLLKKTEKSAFSSYARIGIFRRYMLLGESDRAEKVLKKALKTLPENPELSAVYTHFLLRSERLDEALEFSRCLEGTSYGSLYSEAMLKKRMTTGEAQSTAHFLKDDLVPVYVEAYNGTGDDRWLRDSALIYLAVGDYEAAALLGFDKDMKLVTGFCSKL